MPGVFVATLPGAPAHGAFDQLLANSKRQIRARYPNGDPEGVSGLCFTKGQCTDDQSLCTQGKGQWPAAGEGCTGFALGDSTEHVFLGPDQTYGGHMTVDGPSRAMGSKLTGDTTWWTQYTSTVFAVPAALWDIFPTSTVSCFFGSPFSRPSSIAPQLASWSARATSWTNVNESIVSMLHPEMWANWWFEVDRVNLTDAGKPVIEFRRGGWQDAQGESMKNGTAFFIENIKEELDAPGEWYHERASQQLYYMPNSTNSSGDPASTAVELGKIGWTVPVLETLVSVRGFEGPSRSGYATHISLEAITFTGTSRTVLRDYVYPSSGDWAIHPGGALFVENAEAVNITGCNFSRTGGNAVYLSRHTSHVSIVENSFRYIGESGVASVGATQLADGTAPTFPTGTLVTRNYFIDLGTFGKQVSCYFHALSANATVTDNVCVNIPRAGITFNDGAFGGHLVARNLIANSVRETTDHGPFNSWGRRPMIYDAVDGTGPRIEPQRTWIVKNLFFADYNGWFGVDSDDGSYKYNVSSNFMVYGGCKNYLSADKACGPDNVIVYPGIENRSGSNYRCQSDYQTGSDPSGVLWNQYYFENSCFQAEENDAPAAFFSLCCQGCKASGLSDASGFRSWNNTYYSPSARFVPGSDGAHNCQIGNFSSWQEHGQDSGSKVAHTPPADEIVALGMRALL